jgi:hypothetical protein
MRLEESARIGVGELVGVQREERVGQPPGQRSQGSRSAQRDRTLEKDFALFEPPRNQRGSDRI